MSPGVFLMFACLCSTTLSADELPAVAAPAAATSREGIRFIPTTQYAARELSGFRVLVNRDLTDSRAEVGTAALNLLETKLGELRQRLPVKTWARLKEVPIWVGVNDYEAPNAVYHPSADWLREHGYNPEMARAVQIPNAAVFIDWSIGQPMIVLHELAHAYHHQVLGHDCAELRERFEQVCASGLYEKVLDGQTGKPRRAYALNNVQEFFAEMSEAFWGRNDMSPFTREELRAHDGATCDLIERLWNR